MKITNNRIGKVTIVIPTGTALILMIGAVLLAFGGYHLYYA